MREFLPRFVRHLDGKNGIVVSTLRETFLLFYTALISLVIQTLT